MHYFPNMIIILLIFALKLLKQVWSVFVKVLQPHTDPLLIDVGQEEAVLLVQVVI